MGVHLSRMLGHRSPCFHLKATQDLEVCLSHPTCAVDQVACQACQACLVRRVAKEAQGRILQSHHCRVKTGPFHQACHTSMRPLMYSRQHHQRTDSKLSCRPSWLVLLLKACCNNKARLFHRSPRLQITCSHIP